MTWSGRNAWNKHCTLIWTLLQIVTHNWRSCWFLNDIPLPTSSTVQRHIQLFWDSSFRRKGVHHLLWDIFKSLWLWKLPFFSTRRKLRHCRVRPWHFVMQDLEIQLWCWQTVFDSNKSAANYVTCGPGVPFSKCTHVRIRISRYTYNYQCIYVYIPSVDKQIDGKEARQR